MNDSYYRLDVLRNDSHITVHEVQADFKFSIKYSDKTSSTIKITDPVTDDDGNIVNLETGDILMFRYNIPLLPYPVWEGVIQSINYNDIKSPYDVRTLTLSCVSLNALLDNVYVNEIYINQNIGEILTDLSEKYLANKLGIYYGNNVYPTDIEFNNYTVNDMKLSQVFSELAQYVNGQWTLNILIDRTGGVEKEVIQFTFTPNYEYKKVITIDDNNCAFFFSRKDDNRFIRNVQILENSYIQTGLQTQRFTYTEGSSFITNFLLYRQPTIRVNGISASVGIRYIDDEQLDKQFLWEYKSSEVVENNSYSGTKLQTGDIVEIAYYGIAQIRYVYEAVNNIEKYKRIEKLDDMAGEIMTYEDAANRAELLISRNLTPKVDIKIRGDRDTVSRFGYRISMFSGIWSFNLPQYNLTGDYIITQVDWQSLGNNDSNLGFVLYLSNKEYLVKNGTIISGAYEKLKNLSVRAGEKVTISKMIIESQKLTEQVVAEIDPFRQWVTTEQADQPVFPFALGLSSGTSVPIVVV